MTLIEGEVVKKVMRFHDQMEMIDNTIKFTSLNCRGLESAQHSVSELFNKVDILTIQKQWLLPVFKPVDYGEIQSHADEWLSELGYLEGVLHSNTYDRVITLGGFNTGLRMKNKRFSKLLTSFIENWDLTVVGLNETIILRFGLI